MVKQREESMLLTRRHLFHFLFRVFSIVPGGRLIIQCAGESASKSCVILDYVTDHVMSCPAEMSGDIYVSPDVKYLLVVNNSQALLSVYSLDIYGK